MPPRPVDTPLPTQVLVDDTFSPDDLLAIAAAVNEWNLALQGQVHLDLALFNFNRSPPETAITIAKVTSTHPHIPQRSTAVLAWTDYLGGSRIYVVRDRVDTDFQTIIMHELGHVFGADDTTTPGLMYEHANAAYQGIGRIDPETAEIARRYMKR